MNELVLFAGAGGSILASQLLGWDVVCAVELDHYCRESLMARQDDGSLAPFVIWDDIISFDGKPWRGVVDCVSGGFPCVGISPERLNARYGKQIGLDDPKSGLWAHQLRIIGEVEPSIARVENHPNLTKRGLGTILGALSEMGYDANGHLYAVTPLALATNGNASGLRLPTPTSHNAKESGYPGEHRRKSKPLGAIFGGKPNPEYVEWMMGWPIGWTALKPLETARYQQWRHWHNCS